jgi:hypothetical protein
VCSGTDDQATIAALFARGTAEDAGGEPPPLAGGGTVVLGEGTFVFSAPLVVDVDAVTVTGVPASRITAGDAFGAGQPLVYVGNDAEGRPAGGVVLRGFTVEGRPGVTAGIHLRGFRSRLEHTTVTGCEAGVVVEDYPGWTTYDTVVDGCRADMNLGDGFWFGGTDIHVVACVSADNGGRGMVLATASQQVTDCRVSGNGGAGVVLDGGGTRSKVVSCLVDDNTDGGIVVRTDGGLIAQAVISSCALAGNTGRGEGVVDEILLEGTGGGTLGGIAVTGNTVSHRDGRPAARAGIRLGAGATQVVVVGNVVRVPAGAPPILVDTDDATHVVAANGEHAG